MRTVLRFIGTMVCLAASGAVFAADQEGVNYKAGMASKVITPSESLWMAGYGGRNKPSEGKVHDLYLKVLALEDPAGGRLVLVTSDLLDMPRPLSEAVAEEVRKHAGLPRERLLLTVSHNHTGPVLGNSSLIGMYDMPPELAKKSEDYTKELQEKMVAVVTEALADLKPARLAFGSGKAGFALNRREKKPNGRTVLGRNPAGPVDHDVPVLRVQTPKGTLRAVVFGYACHNVTLGPSYEWCGDYAGFAQAIMQEKHPGALALFWSGCGGDANPGLRGTVKECQQNGQELADAVQKVLDGQMTPVQNAWSAKYATISIPLDTLPSKEKLAADHLSKQFPVRARASKLLKIIEKEGKLDDHYRHYPIQVWRLGDSLIWVALGGEVTVDYALRLKKELSGKPLWVTAYANDVMAYIPTARQLQEGGYEPDYSMTYYGQPTKWAPALEDKIIAKVEEMVKAVEK